MKKKSLALHPAESETHLSNLSVARRNIFVHTHDKKIKNKKKEMSNGSSLLRSKLTINLYDVISEDECENNFDMTDFDRAEFQLPDFSHGYKNHIPIWLD